MVALHWAGRITSHNSAFSEAPRGRVSFICPRAYTMDKTVKVREQDNCCNGNRVEGGEGGAYENVHEFWRRAVQVLVFFFYNYKCPPEKGLEEKKKKKRKRKERACSTRPGGTVRVCVAAVAGLGAWTISVS